MPFEVRISFAGSFWSGIKIGKSGSSLVNYISCSVLKTDELCMNSFDRVYACRGISYVNLYVVNSTHDHKNKTFYQANHLQLRELLSNLEKTVSYLPYSAEK